MSVNHLLRTQSTQVPKWSNLYVNSLRAKNGISIDQNAGTYNVYLNTDFGSDANDGTSSNPVLTLERAIELLSNTSYDLGIINCDGVLPLSPSKNIPELGNVIDLSSLDGKYAEIQIVGTPTIDSVPFTYVGTNATWGTSPASFRHLDTLTIAGSPTVCHKFQNDKYFYINSNTATDANLIGGKNIITNDDIELITPSTQEFLITENTTIITNTLLSIKEMTLNKTSGYLFCNDKCSIKGCELQGNDLLRGAVSIEGCHTNAGSKCIEFDCTANINSLNHDGEIYIRGIDVSKLTDISSNVTSTNRIFISQSNCKLQNSLFRECGISILENSTLNCSNVSFIGSFTHPALEVTSSSEVYCAGCYIGIQGPSQMVSIQQNSSAVFDGSVNSPNNSTEFARATGLSSISFINGPGINIDAGVSSPNITIDLRSSLQILGVAGTMSCGATCIVLKNGSDAFIGDAAYVNSGAGLNFIKVGALADQAGGPLVNQFDAATSFCTLNV